MDIDIETIIENAYTDEWEIRSILKKHNLKQIGEGSSRIVLDYDENTVIKVAYNNLGLVQNQFEYETYSKNKRQRLAKIFNHSSSFKYLISEKCKSLNSFGWIHPAKLLYFVTRFCTINDVAKELPMAPDDFVTSVFDNIVKLKNTITICNVADIGTRDQIGINNKKQFVLLDYGADENIMRKYYW